MGRAPTRLKLFENRWLEKLTVVTAPMFMALWSFGLPLIAWAAWETASPLTAVALALTGWLIWTFTEYALHRYLFHWQPDSTTMAQFVFILHGNHHAVPNDPLRNLMPPMVSIPVGVLVGAGLAALIGPCGLWVLFGFMTGYVVYDLVHYACHQWPMKSKIGQMFKHHHMRHHHGRDNGNYAITGMMWDRLLATNLKRQRR